MHAIIKAQGKQYKVEAGDILTVDRLEVEPGADYVNDQVLLLSGDDGVKVGAPLVAGAVVKGTILDHVRGKKLLVFKMKRRKSYRRTKGHRSELTRIKIQSVG